jgi:hypothetical protein
MLVQQRTYYPLPEQAEQEAKKVREAELAAIEVRILF